MIYRTLPAYNKVFVLPTDVMCAKHGEIPENAIHRWMERGRSRARCGLCARERAGVSYKRRRSSILENKKKRYDSDPEKAKMEAKRNRFNAKMKAFRAYSEGEPRCVTCGDTEVSHLSLDHIHNDGRDHRKMIGKGRRIYHWVSKHGFPEGFQVLCHNCNRLKYYMTVASNSESAEYRMALKIEVLSEYAGGTNPECAICKNQDIRVLTVDHIGGGGSAHRRDYGRSNFYMWFKKNGFPNGYRVLCFNHNLGLKCTNGV
jgi:uncharacterized protein (DUF3820 family)